MTGPLFDTGVIFATLDRADAWHVRSVELISDLSAPPRLPVTILPEVCYLSRKSLGAHVELGFVADLMAANFVVEGLQPSDVVRAHELMSRYPDLGFVDATVVAIAERLRLDTIATTDRRHFSAVRPKHIERFTLVP